jgi:hypothetical protein
MTTRLSKRRVSRLRFVFIIKVNYLGLSIFKNTIFEK